MSVLITDFAGYRDLFWATKLYAITRMWTLVTKMVVKEVSVILEMAVNTFDIHQAYTMKIFRP